VEQRSRNEGESHCESSQTCRSIKAPVMGIATGHIFRVASPWACRHRPAFVIEGISVLEKVGNGDHVVGRELASFLLICLVRNRMSCNACELFRRGNFPHSFAARRDRARELHLRAKGSHRARRAGPSFAGPRLSLAPVGGARRGPRGKPSLICARSVLGARPGAWIASSEPCALSSSTSSPSCRQ